MLRFTAPAAAGSVSPCWRWSSFLGLPGCGYNDFQSLDEQVKAAWSEVLNQYQRRCRPDPEHRRDRQGRGELRAGHADQGDRGARQGDLDPGHARARQRPGRVPEIPAGAGRAEQRAEPPDGRHRAIPELKANQAFQDLRVTLEGTENRITVARNSYIADRAGTTTSRCAACRPTSRR